MDAFSYLSVLLSIILGLAITQILQGYRALLLSRNRIIFYAPPLIWSLLILVFATQSWWASFGLVDHRGWTFASFSILLLQNILLYMMAAVVLPDAPANEQTNLRTHYYNEVRPFFGLSLAMLATSIAKDWMLDGKLPSAENLAFHVFFGVLSVLGIILSRPRVHEVIAPLMAAFTVSYIALLFSRL